MRLGENEGTSATDLPIEQHYNPGRVGCNIPCRNMCTLTFVALFLNAYQCLKSELWFQILHQPFKLNCVYNLK